MPKNPRMETTDLVPICCTQKLECIEIRVELYPPKRYIKDTLKSQLLVPASVSHFKIGRLLICLITNVIKLKMRSLR